MDDAKFNFLIDLINNLEDNSERYQYICRSIDTLNIPKYFKVLIVKKYT